MRRLRGNRIGVWLGVLAVAFYTWLPHHFAIDVVHAAVHVEAHHHAGTGPASDHRHGHDPADHNTHHTCPICAAAAASAGPAAAMLPILAALPAPRSTTASARIAEATADLRAAPLTPYAPRGPPPAV
jgi:hypothetical protein